MSGVMNQSVSRSELGRVDADLATRVAEYVCGLLEPAEHAEMHVILSRDDQALAVALAWEEELLTLVDTLPPEPPSATLRHNLQRSLGIGPPPAPSQTELLRRRSAEAAPAVNTSMKRADSQSTTHKRTHPSPIERFEPKLGGLENKSNAGSVLNSATAPQNTHPASSEPESAPLQPGTPTLDMPPQRDSAGRAHHNPQSIHRADLGSDVGSSVARTNTNASASAQAQTQYPFNSRPTNTPEAPSKDAQKVGAPSTAGAAPAPRASGTSGVSAPSSGEHAARERFLRRKLWIWRLIGLTATAAAIIGFVVPSEPPPAPVQVIKVAPTRAAILLAPGTTSTPAWTATFDASGNLRMQPLVHTEVPTGKQALLWTRSERIPEPRLLGAIDPNRPIQVPASTFGVPGEDQLLEITLEADEDAARGLANGPILYIGKITTFGAEGSTSTGSPGAASANETPSAGQSGPHEQRGVPSPNSPASGAITR